MPKKPLLRDEILSKYSTEIHPDGEPFQKLAMLEQPTFGVSFQSELDLAHSEQTDDLSAESSAAFNVVPQGSRIIPMLHQTSTALDILENLRRGITTSVLGDPLGAGKTYEALLAFLHLRRASPHLRIVITVPDVVIPDWIEALSNLSIAASDCQIISEPATIGSIDILNLPTVLFVKQSITLSNSNPSHGMALQKLQAIYSLPCLYVFDEQPSPTSTTLTKIYECAKIYPRLLLSGTVVTNSIQDFGHHFNNTNQLGSPQISLLMSKISNYFSRYFTTSFAGTDPSIPGDRLLDFLNLSAITHKTFYSRMSSSLPIRLPQAVERFLCIDVMTGDAAVSNIRAEPAVLLTGMGASARVDTLTDDLFKDSLSSRWHQRKLELLTATCRLPRPVFDITDILVVTANQKTSAYLMEALPHHIEAVKYTCILIKDTERDAKIQTAHEAGLSVVLITESARVEGFNVQNHLGRIIFFDAVRDAGNYAQAVGRGVRRGNQKPVVEIEQYCTSRTADYVKERLDATRKAKGLLEMIHADPAAIFLLLTQDVLTRHQAQVRSGVNFKNSLTSIYMALDFISQNLEIIATSSDSKQAIINLIGLLTCNTPPPILSNSLIHLFLFEEDMKPFAFDERSAALFSNMERCMATCKKHFLNAIKSLDMPTLLQPPYLDLAYGFNLVEEYLFALKIIIEQHPVLLSDSFSILKIVYSVTSEVFPQRAELQSGLLHRLKENGFFSTLIFEQLVHEPFLLFAFIDANVEPEISSHMISWLTPALSVHQEEVYQVLCRFSAYSLEKAQKSLGPILASLYTEIESLADSVPEVIYRNQRYDILAEHFGKHAEWLARLCRFAEMLGSEHNTLILRQEIGARGKKLLKMCSKEQRKELLTRYKEFLSEVRQPRGAAAVEEGAPDKTSKRKKTAHRQAIDAPPLLPASLPQQQYSFFSPNAPCEQMPPLPPVTQPASVFHGFSFFNSAQLSNSSSAASLGVATAYEAPPEGQPNPDWNPEIDTPFDLDALLLATNPNNTLSLPDDFSVDDFLEFLSNPGNLPFDEPTAENAPFSPGAPGGGSY